MSSWPIYLIAICAVTAPIGAGMYLTLLAGAIIWRVIMGVGDE